MRDIFPEELETWQEFEEQARSLLTRYGYQEIRTPLVEEKSLFERSVGQDTDIVMKEMYTFLDRKGRNLALRPEGTASVVRAYIQSQYYQRKKISRFWYEGPMFRYDRPQKGRYRQFYQLGVEILGGKDPYFDVEAISLLRELVVAAEVSDAQIHLNSLGCPACQQNYREILRTFLRSNEVRFCQDCQRRLQSNILRIFDCKNAQCAEVVRVSPPLIDKLCTSCLAHLQAVKEALDNLGVPVKIDQWLVRGLDYYTGPVFEAFVSQETNAIAAGGRYDTLVSSLGGPNLPAVGFAIGLDRLMTLKDSRTHRASVIRAFFLGGRAKSVGISLIDNLRRLGLAVEVDYEDRPLKTHLQIAHREKIQWCLIMGENEIAQQKFLLKNMETRHQYTIALNEAGQKIRELTCSETASVGK
ncbi:MAG: histidine--tRNA ligase [Candidatus Omnitrophica bacterium]|nr:histidine--tRNA ligase [Candidatus Omnitrophota bacterium]